jgi:DNA primase
LEKLTKVEFTNLDKILYPEPRITKAQVVEYYIRMAPKMLSILTDRPIVLTRFPNGVARAPTKHIEEALRIVKEISA